MIKPEYYQKVPFCFFAPVAISNSSSTFADQIQQELRVHDRCGCLVHPLSHVQQFLVFVPLEMLSILAVFFVELVSPLFWTQAPGTSISVLLYADFFLLLFLNVTCEKIDCCSVMILIP